MCISLRTVVRSTVQSSSDIHVSSLLTSCRQASQLSYCLLEGKKKAVVPYNNDCLPEELTMEPFDVEQKLANKFLNPQDLMASPTGS